LRITAVNIRNISEITLSLELFQSVRVGLMPLDVDAAKRPSPWTAVDQGRGRFLWSRAGNFLPTHL